MSQTYCIAAIAYTWLHPEPYVIATQVELAEQFPDAQIIERIDADSWHDAKKAFVQKFGDFM